MVEAMTTNSWSKDNLIAHMQKVETAREANWVQSLEGRKLAELEFHNRDRDKSFVESLPKDTFEKLHGNKKYYSTVQLSRDYVTGWMAKHAQDKIFLDYACGNGLNALFAAKSRARLAIGLDISDISVRNAREKAQADGLSGNTFFFQGDCENTLLPDNSIDTILCSGMLHHLDLSYALPELRRILKPGGRILAVEALDYNPMIKLYRNMTPQMRTEWEKAHILSYKDLRFAERFFDIGEVRHFHLLSIAGAFVPTLLPLFNAIDSVLTQVPLVKSMSWMFTFELIKRDVAGAALTPKANMQSHS